MQGESSNNGTTSDTNQDPTNVQAVNDLETTVDMQHESSNNNGTASTMDTNEDTANEVIEITFYLPSLKNI